MRQFGKLCLITLLLLTANTRSTYAQSLGDVAQRETERRAQVTRGRVYTNADLAAVDSQSSTTAPLATAPQAAATEASSGSTKESTPAVGAAIDENPATGTANLKAPPVPNKRDERYWRERSRDVRTRLAKSSVDLAATQARLTAIDMEPQTLANARERELVVKTLARLQIEVSFTKQDVARMETAAKTGNVPPEWIQ